MVSMQVQLDDEVAEALRQLAAAQNRSEIEIVQDALAAFVRVPRLPKGTGRYHSGRSDGSENARQLLQEAVKDGRWP